MSYLQQAYSYHTASAQSLHKPIHGGVSVYTKIPKSTTIGLGTLSGAVIDKKDGKRYLLSNQHVFFPHGPGEFVGTVVPRKSGDSVYQQADPKTPIARTYLTKAENAVWPKATPTAEILSKIGPYHDSALAVPLLPLTFIVNNIGKQGKMIAAKDGMRIKMYGRSSGFQRGIIRKASVNKEYSYTKDPKKKIIRKGVVIADLFTKPGDSGSMIFTDDSANRVVGLHFASPTGLEDRESHISSAVAIANAYNVVFSEAEAPAGSPKPTPAPSPTPIPFPFELPKIDFNDKTTQILLGVGGFSLLMLIVGLSSRS